MAAFRGLIARLTLRGAASASGSAAGAAVAKFRSAIPAGACLDGPSSATLARTGARVTQLESLTVLGATALGAARIQACISRLVHLSGCQDFTVNYLAAWRLLC